MPENPLHDTEFRPAGTGQPQDWPRLAEWLARRGMCLQQRPPPRQFAGGYGNLNYLLQVDGGALVLRRPPPGPLPPGANDMAREHRVLERLHEAYPLAPRALAFCDDPAVLGAPFFLMQYRPGRAVRGVLPGDLAPHARALGELLVDLLAKLHGVQPAAVGLADLGRPEGFLARAVDGWAKRAAAACDGAPPAAAGALLDWLRARAVPAGTVALLHNDFKLDNVLLAPEGGATPVAVIDWDMCTRGDPLFDLATLLSYWTEAGDPPCMHALEQMPSAAHGFPTREQAAARYASRTGCDLASFRFHRVLAVLKLGVVFLQLHARWRRGASDDPRFAGFGELGDALLEFGLEVARERVF